MRFIRPIIHAFYNGSLFLTMGGLLVYCYARICFSSNKYIGLTNIYHSLDSFWITVAISRFSHMNTAMNWKKSYEFLILGTHSFTEIQMLLLCKNLFHTIHTHMNIHWNLHMNIHLSKPMCYLKLTILLNATLISNF